MVARFAAATLGLLAFTLTVIAGLVVGNPVTVTLSRSILALFLFSLLGLALGAVSQMIIAEHEAKRVAEIQARYREEENHRDAGVTPVPMEGPSGEPASVSA
ncbi:MAG TPA: hypothetical protein PKK06_04375 [Phycisphaerae bacterium]|nr:hypothetical protein [Phycisphaerae bacterium]HNU46175.1 hypothetical protein [Phycisphaerae bacterium]